MDAIIDPVPRNILEKELNSERYLRKANNGKNLIYVVNHYNAPNVINEIGRLREITFRAAGGGTGKSIDLDDFDTCENPYEQLIVWNPDDLEIVGGYRFIKCKEAGLNKDGVHNLATTELFHFSDKFIKDFLPYTIELGRSFVQPNYQPSAENRKGLFSLDNLWDGLGAIVLDNPDVKYLFGKVTMYTHFNQEARDRILFFMNYYFPDRENLVTPIHPLKITSNLSEFENELKNQPYKEGHKLLNQSVRALGENIPPLVNSYMNLSATMRTFGTSINEHFGGVEETGILVTIADIYDSKKERHIQSYISEKEK